MREGLSHLAVRGMFGSSIDFVFDPESRVYICLSCARPDAPSLPSDPAADPAFADPWRARAHLAMHERSEDVVPIHTVKCVEGDALDWNAGGDTKLEGEPT
jgi:hypothetical protein